MDPLTDVVEMLDSEVAESCRFEASGPWSLSLPGYRHVKVGAVLSGQSWLITDDTVPVQLKAGDCYLLSSGRPFQAASDLSLEPRDAKALYEAIWPSTVLRLNVIDNDPDRFVQVCASLKFDETTAALLLDYVPSRARIAAGSDGAETLRPALQMLERETRDSAAGTTVMRNMLTQILIVQVVRTLLDCTETDGWLRALRDPNLGPALAAMHVTPGRNWNVAELAAAANMSRSSFAQRFTDGVGVSPLAYLSALRMRAASRLLRSTARTVSSVAAEIGYSSEGAFTHAFKKFCGVTPSAYRRAETK
ncbi:AraC family transcriptional regulator [Mycobacterium montefiorense]|uniref:AraC family transcriptional regulator n=1 Tax=Mycobacterium montefiorense TaxID=154654 RepID=A0AA37PS54_9MYCO|nr:AraC family transcriptional regulator [Mycobacterium montefiorense]GBG39808.1 AraC family transcriptional regulator [Mycobacterium montefiorense]GKU35679.1 AraC family transcriptional regulator [Mycobacterium montefiorense]GKU40684.1 AraC family transcriptional regulator [Mycobacterium montefiorense]GKU45187.1 AraC family transcriptional regulator [Mycobacterium montefiorense]GKU51337.1 AraC family transcriptional regulator [Mycobacterium montefiorense]